jgi:hypothetical protein
MNQQEFVLILFQVVVLVLAFSVHESAHAYVAMRLGDPTAYMLGRVTLNPMKHLDPLGSVLVPLISLVYGGMADRLGQALPGDDAETSATSSATTFWTSMAGPASNLAMATVALILLVIFKHAGHREGVPYDRRRQWLTANHLAVDDGQRCQRSFLLRLLLYYGVLHQPAADRLQPDSDPAAGWQPCAAPLSALPGGAGVQPDWHVGPDRHLAVRRRH